MLNLLHCGDLTNVHPLYRYTEKQLKVQVEFFAAPDQTPSIFGYQQRWNVYPGTKAGHYKATQKSRFVVNH
jgi:hypothetical protein